MQSESAPSSAAAYWDKNAATASSESAHSSLTTNLAERGLLPDVLIRAGIRRLCVQRLREERGDGIEASSERFRATLDALRKSALAIHTDAANAQHYELPPRFFELCLGKRLKYSACFWDETTPDLNAAEERMLALYCERAELMDGQDILELGCGWGSLSLWMAERYPNSRITAVSNSNLQREFIQAKCLRLGFHNLHVVTQDVNQLELSAAQFDRVVSIEMFEHLRNYAQLFARISSWMRPAAKMFVHIFCHRELMYPFETTGDDNWMGRYFFTGGMMPAADTFLHFQNDLQIEQQWRLSGTHYEKTANAWLHNQDANRGEALRIVTDAYGEDTAKIWNQRWRIFWMACAELFGYANGDEWIVAHYRFAKTG